MGEVLTGVGRRVRDGLVVVVLVPPVRDGGREVAADVATRFAGITPYLELSARRQSYVTGKDSHRCCSIN